MSNLGGINPALLAALGRMTIVVAVGHEHDRPGVLITEAYDIWPDIACRAISPAGLAKALRDMAAAIEERGLPQ